MGRVWPNPDDPTEPYFLEADTEAVLEWQREQALKCPGCGLPRDETMGKLPHGAFEAHVMKCHACKERDLALRAYLKEDLADDAGLYAVVHPRTPH